MENVKIKTEFITLGQLIKYLSLVGSGGEVKYFLSENTIFVNGEIENRRGKKLFIDDLVTINENRYRIVKK